MNKNAVLGALMTAMIGVIGYLLFSSGAIGNIVPGAFGNSGNGGNNYSPYAQNGNAGQGQMMPQGQVQAPQQAQPVQQAQTAQQAQPAPKAADKKAAPKGKSSPPPTAPAPAVLQAQNVAQLISLMNTFGNPVAPDQVVGCFVQVEQMDMNGNLRQIAVVNEQCVRTPYADGTVILTRVNSEAFFNLFGSPISLIRFDGLFPDINLFQPRAPGMWFGNNVAQGPTPNCITADNGMNNMLVITLCAN